MTDLIAEVPAYMLQSHELDHVVPLPDKNLKPEGYQHVQTALSAVDSSVWAVRTAARAAAELADSWRDYRVGAAVIAYNFEKPALGLMIGANYKPMQGSGPNIHAEQVAVAKARRAGLDHVMAIAVLGDQADMDANPGQSPTLRPCRRCDTMFAAAPEVRDETLIVSASQDLAVCELYSAGELHDYYTDPATEAGSPVSEFSVYSLADEVSDDEYVSTVLIPYLIPKVQRLYAARSKE